MTRFRCFRLSEAIGVPDYVSFEAESDGAALDKAKRYAAAVSWGTIELWRGGARVFKGLVAPQSEKAAA
jgi:hypothetical protein